MATCKNCAYLLDPFDQRCRRCGHPADNAAPLSGEPHVPAEPVYACHNCGFAFADTRPYCTHCGATAPSAKKAEQDAVWPPPPAGFTPPEPVLLGKLLTGSIAGDVVLGTALFLVPFGFFTVNVMVSAACIAILTGLFSYAFIKPRYPYLARGLGVGMALIGVLFLGMFVVCTTALLGGRR